MATTPSGDRFRILAVHAHPDDESIWTGLLLAKAVRLGHDVRVLTCTLGEEGEVIGDKYANLVSPNQPGMEQTGTDQLGGYRLTELREALEALGIPGGPQLLGGAGCWRDSGMADSPTIQHPRAFARSLVDPEAVAGETVDTCPQHEQLRDAIVQFRPNVVVTYGPDGGYGHPDHIRAHRITHAVVEALNAESSDSAPACIVWAVTEREIAEAALTRRIEPQLPERWSIPQPGEIAAVASAEVDFRIHGSAEDVAAKQAGLRAHATQVWVADGSRSDVNPDALEAYTEDGDVLYALSNDVARVLVPSESYTIGFTRPGWDVTTLTAALGENQENNRDRNE